MIRHFIVFVLLSSSLFSQEFEIVNTIPTNIEFRSIICDSNYIIASCSDGIYRSNDRGGNWEKTSNQIMYAHKFKKVNENIFALTNDGLYRSKSQGKFWELLNNGLPESKIFDLCFYRDHIFLSIGEIVYKSSDYGDSWTNAGDIPIGTGYIRVITTNDSLLFIGCEFFHVYYSDNYGKDWQKWDIEIEDAIWKHVENLIFDDSLVFISQNLENIYLSTNYGKTFDKKIQNKTQISQKEDSFIIYSSPISTSIMTYPYHGDYLYTVDFRFKIGFSSFTCDTEYIYGVSENNLYRISKCIFQIPSFDIDTNYTHCIGDTVELISIQDCAEKNKWTINDGEKVLYSQDSIYLKVDKQSAYKVTLRKSNKFLKYSDSIIFYITVINNPEKPTISMSNDTLYSSSDYGNQWYHEDTLIADAVGQWHYPLYTGNYTVQIGQDICISDMSDVYFVEFVSVEETTTENICISPNPASDYIEIQMTNNTLKGVVESVKVFDVLGNTVLALGDSRFRGNDMNDSEGAKVRLDISALAPGVYFVRVGVWVSKFVKM